MAKDDYFKIVYVILKLSRRKFNDEESFKIS